MNQKTGFLFEKYARRYRKKNLFFQAIKKYEIDAIAKTLELYQTQNARVLDIGCGAGDYIPTLLQHFYFILGLDSSQPMLQLAPVHPRVEYINCDFVDFAFTKKYEFVTCFGVLEFNRNAESFIQKIQGATRSGSYIIVMAPRSSLAFYCYKAYHWRQGVKIYFHSHEKLLNSFSSFTDIKEVRPLGPLNSLYVFQAR